MMPSLGVMNRRLKNEQPPLRRRTSCRSTPPGCCNQKSVAVFRLLAGKDEPLLAEGNAFLIQDLDRKPHNSVKQLSFNLKINKLKQANKQTHVHDRKGITDQREKKKLSIE